MEKLFIFSKIKFQQFFFRSWIGTGNYDANILMAALQKHDLKVNNNDAPIFRIFEKSIIIDFFQVMWFDKRVSVEKINMENVKAVVFNIPSRTLLTLYRGRHWFAVIQKNGMWVAEKSINSEVRIIDFFSSRITDSSKKLMISMRNYWIFFLKIIDFLKKLSDFSIIIDILKKNFDLFD